jgi:hypothetical protein
MTIGDIVEHTDGSIYVLESKSPNGFYCATIIETRPEWRDTNETYEAKPENGYVKVIGHVEGV